MKINWNKGFSLVEVLLAAALMGGLALALAKFNQDQMKSTKTVETKFEYTAILNEIRQILGDNASCRATLENRNGASTAPGVITRIIRYNPLGNIDRFIADASGNGPSYGNGIVKILSFHLVADAPAVLPAGPSSGSTHLVITFSFGSKDRTYVNTNTKKILLNVDVDNSNNIIDCSSAGSTASQFVQRAGDSMYGNLVMEDGTEIILESDKRLKYNVNEIDDSLVKINQLRPVSYKWKSSDEFAYGFIAQEVQKTYPTLVRENENGNLAVKYMQLIPHLVKSVQLLDAENKMLRKEIKNLKTEQATLKKQIKK